MIGGGQTLISASAGGIAERLASRVTRRSFLGRVGRFALVLAGSGTVVGAISKGARATLLGPCDCSDELQCDSTCTGVRPRPSGCASPYDHSISCNKLIGRASCPTNPATVHCGHWVCSCPTSIRPSGMSRWHDCCASAGQCAGLSTCRCMPDIDNVMRPTCCFKRCYSNEQTPCSYIVCRFRTCV